MTKETKFILGSFLGTIIIIVSTVFWLSGRGVSGSSGDSLVLDAPATGLTANTESMDLGKVSYSGGVVSKEFEVKNTSGKKLSLRKISTSCMCTKAKVSIDGKESKFFAMEMRGDLNPLINFDLNDGQTAKVIFEFNPAAHGPQGIGAFERVVTLHFAEGFKDLAFNGEVVN
jgi:hypothetical protein